MKVDLHDKVALVTGAARNIGRAIADALARSGARVAYTDVDESALRAAVNASPGRAHAIRLDVTDAAHVDAAMCEVTERFGGLDILVNNAGVNTAKHRVNIDAFPLEEWQRIIDVDLTGLFNVSRAATRAMLAAGQGGKVINIASVAGLVPLRLQCAFTAAKAGVINLTRTMAIELGGQGILTNCIAPGSILTDGTKQLFYAKDGQFSDKAQQLINHIPLGRPGTCEEIAHAVLFLAAPESSYVNGAILTVDGGWTAGYTREF